MAYVKWQDYAIHDDKVIAGFFGDYRWLSNFHLQPITYEGLIYQSNEHAYQAAKWPKEERHLALTMTPAQVKRWGQQAPITLLEWDLVKESVMLAINIEKYKDPGLLKRLLETGERELVELNHWNDRFWGRSCWTHYYEYP